MNTNYPNGTILKIIETTFHDYPLGTKVKVINKDNHRYHVVNITDSSKDRRWWWVSENQIKLIIWKTIN